MNVSLTPWQRLLSGPFACEPIRPTELAEFYWKTDFKTPDLIEAFSLKVHTNQVADIAGPARFVGCDCARCSRPIYVFARNTAAVRASEILSAAPHYADWCDPRICAECKTELYDKRFEKEREEWKRREMREQELRFMPYADYLQTPEWKRTAEQAKKRASYRCQTCAAGGSLHVHHRTYARRGAEYSKDLIVLCAECHDLFHKNRRLAEGGRSSLDERDPEDGPQKPVAGWLTHGASGRAA